MGERLVCKRALDSVSLTNFEAGQGEIHEVWGGRLSPPPPFVDLNRYTNRYPPNGVLHRFFRRCFLRCFHGAALHEAWQRFMPFWSNLVKGR